MSIAPKPYPCASCPYRKDCPSGVWMRDEYIKLPPYDEREVISQPMALFYCHQSDGTLCSGWVGCHDMDHSLAVRLAARNVSNSDLDAIFDYVSPVPLFASGAEAAEHGMRDVEDPGPEAERVMAKLQDRRERRG